jgi:hypothetical protein
MQATCVPPTELESPSAAVQQFSLRAVVVCIALVACVVATNAFWFASDRRLPSTDEAGHILNAMQYSELFNHFRPWKLSWLQQFLSINPFYPPAVYIYDGLLKLAFGTERWVDNLCIISYTAILTASTFGAAWLVSRCSGVAAIAAIVVNLYPQISWLSHMYMLDLPLVAMVAAGLFALLWWKENPTTFRTAACGAVLAAACFTKQLGAAYLVPACAYLFFTVPRAEKLKLAGMAAVVAAVMVPWGLVNANWISSYAAENAQVMQGVNVNPVLVFGDYLRGLWYSMSGFLSIACIVGLLVTPKEVHKPLAVLYVSAIGGIAFTSLLSCTMPLDRYAAPALIVAAVATACGARELYRGQREVGLAFIGLTLVIGTLQYVSFSFSTPFDRLSANLGVALREYRGARIEKSRPIDTTAWHYDWVLSSVAARDPGSPVWLNILPAYGVFNPHSYELLAKEKGLALKPTTSRRWTIVGDTVEFSPESALWYHWYVLKTGHQGNPFKDAGDAQAYEKLIDFVRSSGRFELAGQRALPDGSSLSLYRQR